MQILRASGDIGGDNGAEIKKQTGSPFENHVTDKKEFIKLFPIGVAKQI